MKKLAQVILSTVLVGALFFAGCAPRVAAKEFKILGFDTMVGVPQTLTGTQASAAFRGVNAGGLPWALTSAAEVFAQRNRIRGMRIAWEPPILRHFTARFESL